MSSSDRRAFLALIAGLPALAACGFEPVYGTSGAADALRGRVQTDAPSDHYEYELVGRIEERLGRPANPIFDLDYDITTRSVAQGITITDEATRYHLIGDALFILTDRRTGKKALTGKVTAFTGYSATGTTVSTLTARQDAHDRLMVMLADQIVTRIIGSAGTLNL